MVEANAAAYKTAAADRTESDEACKLLTVKDSGHHFMLDTCWEQCADGIVRWLEGQDSLEI
jgi:hypothetical protein